MLDDGAYIRERAHLVCDVTATGYYRIVFISIAHTFGLPLQMRSATEAAVGVRSGQGRYTLADHAKYPLQSVIDEFKREVLDKGGAPEAVDALHAVIGFSKKELEVIKNVMAEKLSKKAAPAKAAKEPKAAKPAAGKPKGNPEALAKAREARAAKETENRKYKHAVKLKDISLREGTWTERMVQIIMGNNTTDDAKAELAKDKTYSDKKLDFTWAAQKGYITF